MPSHPYPVRDSNHPQSEVKFYYCSEKSKVESSAYPHGTVLNTKKEVILKPTVYVVNKKSKSKNIIKHKLVDGTIVNYYHMNGIWRMGTRNSWDISFIEEFPKLSNYDLFREAIDECGYSFDESTLDKSKVYTFLFSNPKCHIFSNKYRVWSYDPDFEFIGQPELADENDAYYVEYDQDSGELYPVQSNTWKKITDILYTNRMKIIEQELNYDNAIAKLILRPMFPRIGTNREIEFDLVKLFMEEHLNDHSRVIYEIILKIIEEFDNHVKNDVIIYQGVKLPGNMLIGFDDFKSVTDNFINKRFIISLVCNKIKELSS